MTWKNNLTRLAWHHMLECWVNPEVLVDRASSPVDLATRIRDNFVMAFNRVPDPFVAYIGKVATQHIYFHQLAESLTAMVERQRRHAERRM